jgi:hypothetical protein
MIGMDMGSLGFERLFGDEGWESRRYDKDGDTARRFDGYGSNRSSTGATCQRV